VTVLAVSGYGPGERGVWSAGPIGAYERAGAAAVDAPFACAFSRARHALVAILRSLDVTGRVAVSGLTCSVVPMAVMRAGLRPVYVDIDRRTLNMSPDALSAIEPSPAVALFQRTYGNASGAAEVAARAGALGIPLVEDRAQDVPLSNGEAALGSHPIAALFSNDLLKPVPAGAGGLAVTTDRALAKRVAAWRDRAPAAGPLARVAIRARALGTATLLHPNTYWTLLGVHDMIGRGARPATIDEALEREFGEPRTLSAWEARRGLSWMRRAEEVAAHRTARSIEYADGLAGLTRCEMLPWPAARPYYLFPVLVDDKAALLDEARRRRLELVDWPGSTPLYGVRRAKELAIYGYQPGCCPNAEAVATRLVGLPTHPRVGPDTSRRLLELLRDRYE